MRSCLLILFAGLHAVTQCRAATVAHVNSTTTVLVGGTVHFPFRHWSNKKYEMTFLRRSPRNFKIMAWRSDKPERRLVIDPSYRQRVGFAGTTLIEVQDVQLSDQGEYEVQTNYFGTALRAHDNEQFELRVVEQVSKPVVVVTRNTSHLTLECSAVGGSPITYRWEAQSDSGVGGVTFHGPVLQLQSHGQDGGAYTCIAKNCCSQQSSYAVIAAWDRGSRNRWMILLPVSFIVSILGIFKLYALGKLPDCWKLKKGRG